MKNKSIILILVCFFLLPGLQVRADLTSTFDTDAEGWGIAGNYTSTTPDYESIGGNPDGFIKDSDVVASTWYFVAPSTWSGDMSEYIGGTLSYDIIVLYGYSGYFSAKDVIIWGGDPSVSSSPYLYWNSGIIPPKPPGEAWTPFSVQINSDNFTLYTSGSATFESVMANVYAIYIRGEYYGSSDTEGIDNVRLEAANSASTVPTISEWGMIIFFILLVGSALWVVRKRRRQELA